VNTSLRVVRAQVIEAETAAQLETALNKFFQEGDRKTFLSAIQLASLSILILYAEG
jgi:hypothetical protein